MTSSQVSKQAALLWLVSILLLCYPATTLIVKESHSAIFYLLSLIGLGWIAWRRSSGKSSLDEKQLFFAVSSYFFTTLLIYFLGGANYEGFQSLGKFINLLLVIPVYLLLVRLRIKQEVFWFGLVIGAGIAAGVAIYDIIYATQPRFLGRAHGSTHPIIFGNLSLTMGVMALAGLGYFRERNRWLGVLPILAVLLGLVASFLSAARGGWLAIPVLLALLAWYGRKSLKAWHVGVVLVVVVIMPIGAYFTPGSAVKVKVDSAIHNLSHYAGTSIDDPVRRSSVGTRLELWQASWQIFKEHPLIGVGWGHFQEYTQQQADAGIRNSTIPHWWHPHNQYISALANSGLIGFVSLLLLLFIPLAIFIRSINSSSLEIRRLSFAGMVLIVSYSCFALSEGVFERSHLANFFSFYLALISALIALEKIRKEECDG